MLLVQGTFLWVNNPYWGRSDYTVKFDYFKENQANFNTIFLGSSRLQVGVIPTLFDSISTDKNIRSFNLGVSQLLNPEIYFLYDHILADESIELDYVFMELTALHSMPIDHIRKKNSFYWHNLKYLKYTATYLMHSDASYTKKIGLTGMYLASYLNKYLTVDHLFDNNKKTDCSDWKAENGSCLYDVQMKGDGFVKSKSEWSDAYQYADSQEFINEFYLEKLQQLIELSKAKGTRLIFFIPPRLSRLEYKEVVNMGKALPAENFLSVTNIEQYPQLYLLEHSRDVGHLNREGAALFTKILAEQFLNSN